MKNLNSAYLRERFDDGGNFGDRIEEIKFSAVEFEEAATHSTFYVIDVLVQCVPDGRVLQINIIKSDLYSK